MRRNVSFGFHRFFQGQADSATLQSDGAREGRSSPEDGWRTAFLRVSRELHLNFEKIQIPRRITANQMIRDPSTERNHTETSLTGPMSAVSFMASGKRYDSASARST